MRVAKMRRFAFCKRQRDSRCIGMVGQIAHAH
jgi:hypothetical protein